MAKTIQTVRAREALKVRHEPHWFQVRRGCALGFRKKSNDSDGVWVAKYIDPETGVRTVHSFGTLDHVPPGNRFDAAKLAAEEWFTHLGRGGTSEAVTVAEACRRYVEHLRSEKRDGTATDAEGRFRRWIDADPIGRVELLKLTHAKVRDWRKRLAGTETLPQDKRLKAKKLADSKSVPTRARSASSINRDMTALRAALNLALQDRLVTTDAAWSVALRPIENADRRREGVYLDAEQRRRLAAAAPADLASFIRGLSLLPLRPGAVAALTVADLDRKLGVLRIGKDKKHARSIPLPPATMAHLEGLAKDKTPAAPLFARADGSAWNKDAWKKPFAAAVAAAGLPKVITAYALRHSTITDLIARHGLDLLTVAQLAGTSPAMIGKHYGHLVGDRAREALARLTI